MFSVVIPLYNKELSIQNTIKSVLEQSFQDFEILVINDGSTDNSLAKVQELNNQRIRIIHQTNQGVSAARNKGVEEAKYQLVAFLDGDDLWKKNHLQEVAEMVRLFPNEKVFATSFEYSDNKPLFRHKRSSKIVKIDDYFKDAQEENLMWTSVVVVDKDAFAEAGKFDARLSHGEDLDFWARLAHSNSLIKSTEITAIYRIEAENRSTANFDLTRSRVFNFNFSTVRSESERDYYEKQITGTLRSYLARMKFKLFLKLYTRHRSHISLLKVLKLKK